jgi:molecular chaperone HscB
LNSRSSSPRGSTPISESHFALFGLPATFDLDEAALDAAYRDFQSRVHPDRFAASSDAEKRVALQWATRANEAYRALRSPLQRASYLCELNGAPLDTESNTAMESGFLVQQMEWREALDDARNDAAALDALGASVLAAQSRARQAAGEALAAGDFGAAARRVREWMFVERIADEIGNARERLDDVVRERRA